MRKLRKITGLILLFGLFVFPVAFRHPIIQTGTSAYSEIRRFLDVFNAVRDNYVEDMNAKLLIDGAINGLLNKLDPHSVYISADQIEQINAEYEGSYTGIGVEFAIQDKYPVVIAPMPDTPAERLRLRPGDIILKLDDVFTFGLKENEVRGFLHGELGSLLRMTIQRADFKDPLIFNVIRDRVQIHSIRCAFMVSEDVGYINLGRFSKSTRDEISAVLQKLATKGMKKLIFDLRNNSGGFLDQAVAVTDFFLPGGRKIVYTRGRTQGSNKEFYSTSDLSCKKYPLVVLINRGTASAAEIMVAALQDWDRAVIVGETSFGKGLVQNQITLRDGSVVRVTIARYYSPLGRSIQRPFDDDFSNYYRTEFEGPPIMAQKNHNRTVYSTYSGRKVYGNGGIQPDLESKPAKITATTARLEAKMLFFEFVAQVADDVKRKFGDFNSFLKSYSVDNTTLSLFWTFLQEKNFKLNSSEFNKDQSYIQQEIKSQIARQIWGNDKCFRTRLETDQQFRTAISAFPYAERLSVLSLGTFKN